MKVVLGENNLSLEEVIAVARHGAEVEVSEIVRNKLQKTRQLIEENWMEPDSPLIYSFNTGVGVFKDRRISIEDIPEFQTNLILAHATGIGEPMSTEASRAVMLLRLNAFTLDASGVSLNVVDRILEFLNKGLTPVIPVKGSVGASGDLAPLAHMSGALCGFEEAEIFYEGQRLPAQEAIKKAGVADGLEMLSKDASALINGSTVSLALATLAAWDANNIARHADVGLALSLEAMRGEKDAFVEALHEARPHPGQKKVAANLRQLIGSSNRMTEAARHVLFPGETRAADQAPPPRIQDVYSMRCAPQVHGPVREAIDYATAIIEREINSATDNPLIVDDQGTRRAVSGGHFHGQYIAQATDLLTMAIADLGSICERRIARLIDPTMSYGLPRNLTTGKPGLHTGYATVQCSMSSLVMENRTLSMPGSVDSIPAKGNAEDHVSNSMWCSVKCKNVVENATMIVSTEILMACQALSIVDEIAKDHPLAEPTDAVLKLVREHLPTRLEGDLWYAKDMNNMVSLVKQQNITSLCQEMLEDFA